MYRVKKQEEELDLFALLSNARFERYNLVYELFPIEKKKWHL